MGVHQGAGIDVTVCDRCTRRRACSLEMVEHRCKLMTLLLLSWGSRSVWHQAVGKGLLAQSLLQRKSVDVPENI